MPDTSPAVIEREELKAKALRLRKEGHSYQHIGDQLFVSDDTARNYVLEALKDIRWTRDEAAVEVAELVKQRNDDAINAIYEAVRKGDLGAIDRLIKLNEQLLDLVGAKITKHDITSGGRALPVPIHTVEVVLTHDGHVTDEG